MTSIEATTIEDAWFKVLCGLFEKDNRGKYRNAYVTDIDSGSFEGGQQRLQFPMLSVCIKYPETRPLAVGFPEGSNLPSPTDEATIEEYFGNYLMNPTVGANEEYTYGSRLLAYPVYKDYTTMEIGQKSYINQVEWCIKHLRESPHNNHCNITIPMAGDLELKHAPCLRSIDLKVVEGRLNMAVYFRSWDLWGGFPTNIGGFQLLNEYICSELEGVETGSMYAVSPGAHIYSMSWDIARKRIGEV